MSRSSSAAIVVIRGAGETGSAAAWALRDSGFGRILLSELPAPRAVRRGVSFSEALYDGRKVVDGLAARRADSPDVVLAIWRQKAVAIYAGEVRDLPPLLRPDIFVDASMPKSHGNPLHELAPVSIGLGPGFAAPQHCDAVIETDLSPALGRVILQGETSPFSGVPASILGAGAERVLRAAAEGILRTALSPGEEVEAGDILGKVYCDPHMLETQEGLPIDRSLPLRARISGILRGLRRDRSRVERGERIGDIDPRKDRELAFRFSDRARRIAEGVLEAIVTLTSSRASAANVNR